MYQGNYHYIVENPYSTIHWHPVSGVPLPPPHHLGPEKMLRTNRSNDLWWWTASNERLLWYIILHAITYKVICIPWNIEIFQDVDDKMNEIRIIYQKNEKDGTCVRYWMTEQYIITTQFCAHLQNMSGAKNHSAQNRKLQHSMH